MEPLNNILEMFIEVPHHLKAKCMLSSKNKYKLPTLSLSPSLPLSPSSYLPHSLGLPLPSYNLHHVHVEPSDD